MKVDWPGGVAGGVERESVNERGVSFEEHISDEGVDPFVLVDKCLLFS